MTGPTPTRTHLRRLRALTTMLLSIAALCVLTPTSALAIAPTNTGLPEISGATQQGATLSCSEGAWADGPEMWGFQWTLDGAPIAGETASTHAVVEPTGSVLRCIVTAYNGDGSTPATSDPVTVQPPPVPVNTVAPVVEGAPQPTLDVTCNVGEWTGYPDTYLIQWTADGVPIPGAVNISIYTVDPAYVGAELACEVTGSNVTGSDVATSASVTVQELQAPVATMWPFMYGSSDEGGLLYCQPGSWTGNPTFTYAWTANGVTISGATSDFYTISEAPGTDIACVVTATNGAVPVGSTTETTVGVTVVDVIAPSSDGPPSIQGPAVVSQAVSCDLGTWFGSQATATVVWLADGVEIPGEVAQSYVITEPASPAGTQLTCEVTATNYGGSAVALSAAVTVAPLIAPVASTPPSLDWASTGEVDSPVTCFDGVWDNYPDPSRTVLQWLANGVPIAGATEATYTVDVAVTPLGTSLACRITAINDAGSGTATTTPVTVIALAAPSNQYPPSISGVTDEGSELTCYPGTWTDYPANPTSYAYQWRENGVDISGATSATWTIAATAGDIITCRVTATNGPTNGGGSTSAESDPITVVPFGTSTLPSLIASPVIERTPTPGATLRCTSGGWSYSPYAYSYQWLVDEVPVSGATTPTRVVTDPIDSSIRCDVTAYNTSGTAMAQSWSVVVTAPTGPPIADTLPIIEGTPIAGSTLTCTNGTWGNTPDTFAYAWTADGSPISGATAATHVVAEPTGTLIACTVTATNSFGDTTATSDPVTVTIALPQNTTAPTISGAPGIGSTLTCDPGTWTEDPTSYAYEWTADGVAIPGATDPTYVVAEAEGTLVRCRETATNAGGSVTATSSAVVVVAPAPTNTVAPVVSGSSDTGSLLSCTAGTWTPDPTTLDFAWYADGAPIAGATSSTRVIREEEGVSVECVVTASTSGGSTTVASTPVIVTPAAPTNLVAPNISGVASLGAQLTCDPGTWTGYPTSVDLQWTADGAPIPAATNPTYTVTESVGVALRCEVTATNGLGSTVLASAPAPVVPPAPTNIALPSITGDTIVGSTLSCDTGTWTDDPVTFEYAWTDAGIPIGGETGSTYVIAAPVGTQVRCEVTASNAGGSATATSAPIEVTPPAPTNDVVPAITGDLTIGSTLSCSTGSWSGDPSGYAYTWLAWGGPIAGETASTYVIAESIGTAISCQVTATNVTGSGIAESDPVIVAPFAPTNVTAPEVLGDTIEGSVVTCDPGTWTGDPTSFIYAWTAAGSPIAGETTEWYTILDTAGTQLRCEVVAVNVTGSASATSAPITVTPPPPSNTTSPTVSGSHTVGSTLTCGTGAWTNDPDSYAYAWLAWGAPISGETASTYVIGEAVDTAISCQVTATNVSGSGVGESDAIIVAPFAPTSVTAPEVIGNTIEGSTVTCDPGTWTGDPTLFIYAWTAAGSPIAGETNEWYTIAEPAGTQLRCEVTATNVTGPGTATSPAITVTPPNPGNTTPPAISGTTTVGSTLTCATGTWTGSPATWAFTWSADGSPIPGATTATHLIAEAVDTTIQCEVTATNVTGSDTATSGSVTVTATPVAPINTSPPAISGSTLVGSTLTCDPGTWTGSPTAYAYVWEANASPIPGETTDTYVIGAPTGADITCTVTATNGTGDSTETSAPITVTPPAPANTAPPTISGSNTIGSTLTCAPGTWTNSPTFAYAWSADGAPIAGANAATLVIAESAGAVITCEVTGTNVTGSDVATSASITVVALAPANTALPAISGTTTVGSTLSCANGTWSNDPVTYDVAWTANGVAISGATASTHVIAEAVGTLVRCVVTATNSGGSTAATSAAITVAAAPTAPANTALPTISGVPRVGELLTCSNGSWTGAPSTFDHAWTADGVPIPGETSSTYTVAEATGTDLRCVVTATNGVGPTSATSAAATVLPEAPLNTLAPALSGPTTPGSTLSCTTGAWTPLPSSYTYAWRADGALIPGQTTSTHVIGESVGTLLECDVTATNAGGSTTVTSNAFAVTPPPAPTNSALPTISGSTTAGSTITCAPGTWTGAPTAYAYAWTADSVPIGGASTSTYVIAQAPGVQIACDVTAANASGSDTATSSPVTVTATPVAPINTGAPTISGTTTVGSTLTCDSGTWTGSPTAYAYAWRANATPIPGETTDTYVIGAAIGASITCAVTATNATGATSATSAAVTVTPPAPSNTVAPAISGSNTSGATLTCAPGTWTNSPTLSYAWIADGTPVAGATSSTLVISQPIGTVIACEVTGTNVTGSDVATSASITVVALAPANTVLPAISGTTTVGSTLSCSNGTWSNVPVTYGVAWTANGVAISGATASTYVIAEAVGTLVRCVVTATNSGGSTAATSSAITVAAAPTAPANTALPTISGVLRVGELLTCSNGSWTGAPGTFDHAWTADGIPIPGETSSTYTVAEAAGTQIRCVVTATNGVGPTSATSAAATVLPDPPLNTLAPALSGSTAFGSTLGCTTGSWTPLPTSYAYAWRADGAPIPGQTTSTYVIGEAVGTVIECDVTATNAGGSTTATSNAFAVTPPPAPTNSALPTISGVANVGSTLTCAPGSWTSAPTSYTYAWTADGVAIAGATSATYVITQSAGVQLVCEVVASNAGGASTPAASAARTVTSVAAPANTALPAVTGSTTTGSTLACTNGTWTGSPTSYAIAWTADGAPIAGATSSTLVISQAVGVQLRCVVTATNVAGPVSASSVAVTVTAAPAPANIMLPTITGVRTAGATLTCANGTWSGTPTSYTRVWTANGTPIAGATATTLTITQAVGTQLRCSVTATNATGATSATSAATTVTATAPTNTALPSITGATTSGSTLTCSPGTWSGSPSLAFAWIINGATNGSTSSNTYTITEAPGTTIRCDVIGTNAGGSARAGSATLTVTGDASRTLNATSLPTVRTLAGRPAGAYIGGIVRCDPGAWPENTSYTYAWSIGGAPVPGVTRDELLVPRATSGKALVCTVSATSGDLNGVASSPTVTIAAWNVITGTTRTSIGDNLTGTNGNDRILLRAGNDTGRGLSGDDQILGWTGNDVLFGWLGNDRLDGGAGADILHGGGGNDRLVGGTGRDDLRGDAGNDVIDARDAKTTRDVVNCGAGRDTALVNRRDIVRGCEVVRRVA